MPQSVVGAGSVERDGAAELPWSSHLGSVRCRGRWGRGGHRYSRAGGTDAKGAEFTGRNFSSGGDAGDALNGGAAAATRVRAVRRWLRLA
jgi:hypothetical protein